MGSSSNKSKWHKATKIIVNYTAKPNETSGTESKKLSKGKKINAQ